VGDDPIAPLHEQPRKEYTMIPTADTHTCPYCELVFLYHEEVKDHIVHDHREHAAEVATVEMRELPHQ
jgi:5-methylcytosine-specific restriction endonuclease McrA